MKNYLTYIFICFASISLQAQDTLSLNACINYAIGHSLQHEQMKYELQQEELNLQQKGFNFLPSVGAYSSGGLNYGRSIDPTSNSYIDSEFFSISGQIEADWVLFEGFSKQNERAYAKFQKQAAQWGYVNNEDELAFQILNAYYNVAYYTGIISIAQQQLKISEFNLRKTQIQVETGLQAKSDLLQIKANLEQSKLDIINAENQADEMRYQLLELMNYPMLENSDIQISDDIDTPELTSLPNIQVLFESFCSQAPSIKMEEAYLKAANKNISVQRGGYLPKLTLNASYGSSYSETYVDHNNKIISFNEQLNRYLNKYIGASLSIPIFYKNEQRTQVKRAIITKSIADNNFEKAKQSLYYQMANNIREIKALRRQAIQTQQKVQADELAYKVAYQKYSEGIIGIIELQSVQEQMAQSKNEQLLANIKLSIKTKTLNFYQGNRFWQF